MSAPSFAGASVSVSASGSASKMTSASAALALAIAAAWSPKTPYVSGQGTISAATPASISPPSIVDVHRLAARPDHVERPAGAVRRPATMRLALVAMVAQRDADGFGDRGRLVEQRSGRHRQAGQLGHQRLEVEQHFQPALADLGLVGRVGGVPGRVLEQVALDHRRHAAAVIALADEALQHVVAAHLLRQLGERLRLGRGVRAGRAAGRAGSSCGTVCEISVSRRGRRARPASRACRSGRGRYGARQIPHCCLPWSFLSRYARCRRPRPSGRRAGFRRRASSSRASRRRSPTS